MEAQGGAEVEGVKEGKTKLIIILKDYTLNLKCIAIWRSVCGGHEHTCCQLFVRILNTFRHILDCNISNLKLLLSLEVVIF